MVREGALNPVRVLALVPYALGMAPSQRYRLEQWAPVLSERGITIIWSPFADLALTALLQEKGHFLGKARLFAAAFSRRARVALDPPDHEVVVVHRAACLAGPPWLERSIHARGRPVLYDFDDAIYRLHAAAANRAFAWLKAPGKTAALCRLADHVVVGNETLSSWVLGLTEGLTGRVTVIPSSIDTERYQPLPRPPARRIVVGWMGSSTSQTYLEAAAPLLRAVVAARPVELRVVSNRRPVLPGIEHTWRPWSAETERLELAGFDIGIMPMPDDEWARGKGAFKALQYMAMGVATIASAVGTNREVIDHGRSGFLAFGTPEWVECVSRLVDNADLRRELGATGRRTVEERYSMRNSAEKFARVLRGLVAPRSGA
jgi:glycosyltransferase involved in cell wall biosynthesis